MLKSIIKATENFCIHQIRTPHTIKEGISKNKTLIAYIDIEENSGKIYRVYIASEMGFIQRVSKLFLDEEDSDEETLIDMTLETTNLIVGSAKVIAIKEERNPFTIKTPHFLKIDRFDCDYDDAKIIKVEDDEMVIAIKEL
ncbi:MAG: chemotaxis protein CheX [Sulfurimonas sp.]|nr:chemotaxis protein CheX [Sulfurimonas sp.]